MYFLQAGTYINPWRGYGWTGSPTDSLGVAHEEKYKIPSTEIGGNLNEFSVNFTKNYISAGYLGAGRAVVIVSAGWIGTGMVYSASVTYPWPSSNTTLILNWGASAACNPAVATAQNATAANMGSAPLTMSLYTHASYRLDMALSLDPATGAPAANQPFGYRHPANKLVAILWHQGEQDYGGGFPLASWAGCLAGLVAGWRGRYGADVPFIAGTFTFTQQDYLAYSYLDFLRFTFGRGLYGSPPHSSAASGAFSGYYEVLTNATMPVLALPRVGLADSYYFVDPYSGALEYSIAPYDPGTTIHFSEVGCAWPPRDSSQFLFFFFVF